MPTVFIIWNCFGTSIYAHRVYIHIDLILENPYTFSGLVLSVCYILTVGNKSNLGFSGSQFVKHQHHVNWILYLRMLKWNNFWQHTNLQKNESSLSKGMKLIHKQVMKNFKTMFSSISMHSSDFNGVHIWLITL